MYRNQLSKASGVPDVHRFHLWNIGASELAGFQQFLPDSHVLGTQRQKLSA
jgi:hypothetical protein